MKRTLAIVLAAVLIMSMTFTASAFAATTDYPTAKVSVNGKAVQWTDMEPVNISGMVFVPIREALEAFGQTVTWMNDTKTVETTDSTTGLWVKLDLSSPTVVTKHQNIERSMDMVSAPMLINGKTMVSIRALTDIYGKIVSYDSATQTVLVNDYSQNVSSVGTLDVAKTYEGYVGDIVKVSVTEDETYKYIAPANRDFIFIAKEALSAGGQNMYFKAVTVNKDANVTVQKENVETVATTDAAITTNAAITTPAAVMPVESYKAAIADPSGVAVTADSTTTTAITVGSYVKVALPAASTGNSWFVTALPAGLTQVADNPFTFKVTTNANMSLTFDAMSAWGGESTEQVIFVIQGETAAAE